MTVRELIEMLDEHDQDAEIRVAYQENYPLVGTLANVADTENCVIVQGPE